MVTWFRSSSALARAIAARSRRAGRPTRRRAGAPGATGSPCTEPPVFRRRENKIRNPAASNIMNVARDFGTPQPVATMTERQLARRQALLDAVMQLAAERGLLNVQMKSVAERSGVALGTAYRYFASKDHLLACALAEWHGRLVSQVLTERATDDSRLTPDEAADRLVGVVHRGLRGFQRQPNYAALLTYVLSSHDPFASEVLTGINRGYDDLLREVLGEL